MDGDFYQMPLSIEDKVKSKAKSNITSYKANKIVDLNVRFFFDNQF